MKSEVKAALITGICTILAAIIALIPVWRAAEKSGEQKTIFANESTLDERYNEGYDAGYIDGYKKSENEVGNSSTNNDGTNNKPKSTDVWLNELEYFNYQNKGSNSWYSMALEEWKAASDKDTIGNTYENALKFNVNGTWDGNYIFLEYYLNSKHTTFEGLISVCYESRTTQGKVIFVVYGDDKILYQTESFGPETIPIDFNINIEGVTKLKIELVPERCQENWKIGILNPKLY